MTYIYDIGGTNNVSWEKKATVAYHFIESADEDFFINFSNNLNTIIASEEVTGVFEAGEVKFIWKINGKLDVLETETFLISLVKERASWPVWFNEEGDISNVPLVEGSLGELYYAIINPANKFMLSMAAATGAAAGSFKKLLNEFSQEGGIKITPLFEDNVDKTTLMWDYYKKIGLSLNFPTADDLSEFQTTKEGALLGMLEEMGGLKIDVTITAPKQKQVLNASQLRDTVQTLISNDFCTKLVVRGSEFESGDVEEYDIKNAQVKYSEQIEISGTYMTIEEATSVLIRALNDKVSELID